MNKEEFSRIAMIIRTAYPTQKLFQTEESYEVWYMLLSDLDYRSVESFIYCWTKKEPFAPKISDISQSCEKQVQTYSLPLTVRKTNPFYLGDGR